ncbi:MAG: methylated-DNA--[protein]-cysteine S-methyltransferase [Deltaproteobacteria bacterium]|nr:methylated-DNA--[protein]-cysteine S-methyltransferase [Deltaproteobacteria bacterium]
MTAHVLDVESPIRTLRLRSNREALVSLAMLDDPREPIGAGEACCEDSVLERTRGELAAYFAGGLRDFTVPLAPAGTPFQLRVWEALRAIPFGTTQSYREVAIRIGQPTATRAVGLANGRNPIAVIVPCHRVIGADGSLTGYGGGLRRKRILLDHEARCCGATGSEPAACGPDRGPLPAAARPHLMPGPSCVTDAPGAGMGRS